MAHETFTDDFFRAVGAWQRGWAEQKDRREVLTSDLQAAIAKTTLPPGALTAAEKCFRKRFLYGSNPENGGDHAPILLGGSYDEGVASWTTDLDFAKRFKGEVRGDANTAIFGHVPTTDEVVLNIKALWALPEFQAAVEDYAKRGGANADALQNFRDDQAEIILNAPLRVEEIEHFCGVIGTFDQLFELAGITSDLEDAFVQQLKDQDNLPGGTYWLGKDAAQRVVSATLDKWRLRHGKAR